MTEVLYSKPKEHLLSKPFAQQLVSLLQIAEESGAVELVGKPVDVLDLCGNQTRETRTFVRIVGIEDLDVSIEEYQAVFILDLGSKQSTIEMFFHQCLIQVLRAVPDKQEELINTFITIVKKYTL